MMHTETRKILTPMRALGVRISLLLLLTLGWAGWAQAFSYVATSALDSSSDASGVTSVTCAKPTGTVDNDIMFAVVKVPAAESVTAPSGWSTAPFPLIDDDAGLGIRFLLYSRVAASEGTTYAWSWTTSGRAGCSIYTFRDDFNTSDPIDVTSNTSYETSGTTARAASMTTSAANQPVILFPVTHTALSGAQCSSYPALTTFTEHVDTVDTAGSRFGRCVASGVWSSSGATGDLDITLVNSLTAKHAFAVSLNPAAGGGATPRNLMLMGVGN